jgi:hypothetical protein
MAVMLFYSVIIEFAAPEWSRQHLQTEETFGCVIRLVETQAGSRHSFALYEGQEPVYTLDDDETGSLLRLLGQISLRTPWDAVIGRDGATCTLRLVGPMSHAEFSWWVEVPKEWESIGAVFDYIMSLAKRHGHAPALCG